MKKDAVDNVMNSKINSYLVKYCVLSILLINFGCREKNITDYIEERWPGTDLTQFSSFDLMKERQPFLLVKIPEGYGVYDLFYKKYALKPTSRCYSVQQINDSVWYMFNIQQKPYRIIQLPKVWLFDTEDFEIQSFAYEDEEGNSNIDYIKDIAQEYEYDWETEDGNFREAYKDSKDAYIILGKMVRSSGCENTPRNNLLWHQIIKELISETGMPQDTLISQMQDIIGWYYGGSQSEMNNASYMEQVIAQYEQLDVIANHLDDFPEYYDEYEAFSKLETAVFYKWIDDMYAHNHYSSLSMDVSYGIINCMNENTPLLTDQYNLISNSKVQREDRGKILKVSINPQSDNASNIDSLVEDWISIRGNISQQLPNTISKRYDDITNKIMDNFNKLNVLDYEL